MSSNTTVATNNYNVDKKSNVSYLQNEWVEIIEPRTKQRIYANLESGICAKDPPEGAIVNRSEDFSDHWWELYDQKTGKYYYYNPEQQRTAWTKPRESSSNTIGNTSGNNKKKLLIIPVSKLQTFKKLSSHNEPAPERCDASTQTIASNLVSTGTQTIRESFLEEQLNDKLKLVDLSNDSSKSSCSFSGDNSKSSSYVNHRSELNTKRDRPVYPRNQTFKQNDVVPSSTKQAPPRPPINYEYISKGKNNSSQFGKSLDYRDDASNCDSYTSYFVTDQTERPPIRIKSPLRHHYHNQHNNYHARSTDDYISSTSTFVNPSSRQNSQSVSQAPHQKLVTNNLSHYLVREARAMGIALISDDDMDDDDPDSDDDCLLDDDEDTDLRDDVSSHDLNASQEIAEDSSEGWKSFSDQDSPNSTAAKSLQKSPLLCETSPTFGFNSIIDEEKNPASCMSQQLDHQKLVDNFKKSRQSSSFGLQDSLGRAYKLETNQAVQMIKTMADSYLNNDSKEQISDRRLRQLSALSTLPRPSKETKDKIALSKQDDRSRDIDADYDVVEENCGYYSDSERNQLNNMTTKDRLPTRLIGQQKQQPNSSFDRNKSSRGSTFSVESFARENLTRHPKKGSLLFNRKVKWSRMISWTKNSIKQPMISSVSSDLNSDSIASFKLIQQYMGDRKVTVTKKYRQILAQTTGPNEDQQHSGGKARHMGRSYSLNYNGDAQSQAVGNPANLPDRLRDELAFELVVKGCLKNALRDEIYVQMARQLTDNPNQESIRWGMVLMSILLSYFSPSSKFSPFLLSFLESYSHQMAQDVSLPRLEKRLRQCNLTYCRKPADGKEISIIRLSITKWPQYCGVFGESLERLMSLQSCSPYLKTLRLPWILTTLGNKLIETRGFETEGIFRCAADHDLIAQLRLEIDCVDFRKITDAKQVDSLLSNVQDPHVIAGLLKLFFRQLYEPVFPSSLYDICLQNSTDGQMVCCIFNEHLPNLNKDVVAYLIRLLQNLSQEDKVTFTKMDSSNLSMVWAPNLLRAPESNQQSSMDNSSNSIGNLENLVGGNSGSKNGSKWSISNGSQPHGLEGNEQQQHNNQSSNNLLPTISQSNIFEQTRQEMQFIRSLIIHLDTSFIENVI